MAYYVIFTKRYKVEDLRDNNYGYELPSSIITIIEECEEDEDEERGSILNKILDLCDHTDLEMLSDYDTVDLLISNYENFSSDEDALLKALVRQAQLKAPYF